MVIVKALIISCLGLAVLLLVGCAKSDDSPSLLNLQQERATVPISSALAELDAMTVPDGVKPEVLQQLKDALRTALIARREEKIVSTPPTGLANAIPDLALIDNGDGTANLTWSYYNHGDYNQDGVVGVSDITPIAIHFGETHPLSEKNTIPAVVDGSGNGMVDVADITPIAMNFGVQAASYNIEASDAEDGVYSMVQTVALADGLGKDTARMHFTESITPTMAYWYRAVPLDSGYSAGIPSNAVQASAGGQSPVASIVPDTTSGILPLTVNFDASASYDPDGTIVLYEWDPNGDGVYEADSGADPAYQAIYNLAGTYNAAVRITDDDGLQDTASVFIYVSQTGNQSPVASIAPDTTSGPVPLTVNFDASGSYDPDGAIIKFEWDWEGDGVYDLDTGMTPTASHAYTTEGSYNPTVKVTDNDASTSSQSTSIMTTASTQWTHTWGNSEANEISAVCVGQDGNIYAAGTTRAPGAGNNTETLLISYTDTGALRWAKTWDGPNVDRANAICVDGDNNFYIAGDSYSLSGTGHDALLLKYTSDGTLIYATTWGGAGVETSTAIVACNNGDIFLGGYTDSFGAGSDDIFLAKFTSDGTLVWNVTWGGTQMDRLTALQVDAAENVYVAGFTASYGAGSSDALLLKYAPNGVLQWAKIWGGTGLENSRAIGLDGLGYMYVAGGSGSFWAGDSYDCYLLKYSLDGDLSWARTWRDSVAGYGWGLALDDSGHIYVAGNAGNPPTGASLLAYLEDGSLESQRVWQNASSNSYSASIWAVSANEIIIGGHSEDALGSWVIPGGVVSSPSIADSSVTGTSKVPSAYVTPVTGEDLFANGVEDTGGGSIDALVMRIDPTIW